MGITIRKRRLQLDLTQQELADRIDMHTMEISRLERGQRDLRLSTLVRIARGLGIPPAELLEGL